MPLKYSWAFAAWSYRELALTELYEINSVALSEEHEHVELLEHLSVWLVDGGDDGPALCFESVEDHENLLGGESVHASCWFVEEDQSRIGHELHSDREPLLLAPSQQPTSDSELPRLHQLQLSEGSEDLPLT
jgi:hypothetical protein